MILQIREGVFETNSSSTHTITICSAKDFDKWTEEDSNIVYVGDYCDFDFDGRDFVTKEEVLEKAKEINVQQIAQGKEPFYDIEHFFDSSSTDFWSSQTQAAKSGVYTFEEWREDEYLYTYTEEFTTENGDEIVAFGKYGSD